MAVLIYIFLFVDNVSVVSDIQFSYTVLLRYLYNSTIHDSVFIWKRNLKNAVAVGIRTPPILNNAKSFLR